MAARMGGEIAEVKPDLHCFLSTEVREPSMGKCQRMVDRKRRFRFEAPNNASTFEDDAVLYITMESIQGCEVEIKVISSSTFENQRKEAEKASGKN